MPTALELNLQSGEEVLVARSIWIKEVPDDFLNFGNIGDGSYYTTKGLTFRRAPRAEVLEVGGVKGTKVRYLDSYEGEYEMVREGDEKTIHSRFDGFSRERTRFQRVLDSIRYFINRYTTLRI